MTREPSMAPAVSAARPRAIPREALRSIVDGALREGLSHGGDVWGDLTHDPARLARPPRSIDEER
jgi:hypothetical protein